MLKYTPFQVKKPAERIAFVDMWQLVVLMIIMHKSDQSFSSNEKRIIIDIVNCSTGFFQLSKEIMSIKVTGLRTFAPPKTEG